MKKTVFVWKESVYKNRFTCNCGNQLADENGVLIDGKSMVETTSFRRYLYCKKCYKPVAYLTKMEVPEDAEGLMGNISEYERRKMN